MRASGKSTPPTFQAAMMHAVFPGGARLRPRLAVAVAAACGDDRPQVTDAAAAAIELIHCASLVHDDLPSFDDAQTRRARPSVHIKFGVPAAILVGDGLIAVAFETLSSTRLTSDVNIGPMVHTLARCIGPACGIIAGQAWELEPHAELRTYHQLKTGALFEGAVMLGALSAEHDAVSWRAFGAALGEAYQIVDDVLDAAGTQRAAGKPVGQDQLHGRPNAALENGVDGALRRLAELFTSLPNLIPACPAPEAIHVWLEQVKQRLFPPLRSEAARLQISQMIA